MSNWIADTNRWKIPQPPAWFLKALWDQDALLVIIPSRTRKLYILARQRDKTHRVPMLTAAHNDLLRRTRGSDGDMLATHNLLYVDVISGTIGGTWSPAIIQDLKDRDTWAAGGGDKYADKLEAVEKKAEEKTKANWLSDIEHLGGDSWRSLQARTGQRSKLSDQPKVANSPSSGTAGSGLVITD